MLYQLLYDYIEQGLFMSREEACEKLVVYYSLDKLTSGEYDTLFNLLYPKVDKGFDIDSGISTTDEVYEKENEVEVHPMPEKAKEILTSMIHMGKMEDVANKLKVFVDNQQLTQMECATILANEDSIATIPL